MSTPDDHRNLILSLLNATDVELPLLLEQNKSLFDLPFIEFLQQEASKLPPDSASRLLDICDLILTSIMAESRSSELENNDSQISENFEKFNLEKYINFFNTLLEAEQNYYRKECTREEINSILFQNQHYLDLPFIDILQNWVNQILPSLETPENKGYLADIIVNLANHIQEFSHGNRAYNMEISIAAYNIVLKLRSREDAPLDWAGTQNNLGIAYSERILGERGENLEKAIKC